MRNRPGTLNGPHPVVIVPSKENGGAFQSIVRGQIRGLCNHFSLLTRQGGYGIVDNQSEVQRKSHAPCCPLWGKCREAAKGVPLVALSCFHSTNHTPSATR